MFYSGKKLLHIEFYVSNVQIVKGKRLLQVSSINYFPELYSRTWASTPDAV